MQDLGTCGVWLWLTTVFGYDRGFLPSWQVVKGVDPAARARGEDFYRSAYYRGTVKARERQRKVDTRRETILSLCRAVRNVSQSQTRLPFGFTEAAGEPSAAPQNVCQGATV